jgi:hypothetical protein
MAARVIGFPHNFLFTPFHFGWYGVHCVGSQNSRQRPAGKFQVQTKTDLQGNSFASGMRPTICTLNSLFFFGLETFSFEC